MTLTPVLNGAAVSTGAVVVTPMMPLAPVGSAVTVTAPKSSLTLAVKFRATPAVTVNDVPPEKLNTGGLAAGVSVTITVASGVAVSVAPEVGVSVGVSVGGTAVSV